MLSTIEFAVSQAPLAFEGGADLDYCEVKVIDKLWLRAGGSFCVWEL